MAEVEASQVAEPMGLVRLLIDEVVFVKLRGDRELKGKLYAYDSHCNLVLGDVEETIYVTEEDDEEVKILLDGTLIHDGYLVMYVLTTQTISRKSEMLFVRGDSVVLISPNVPT